MSGKQTTSADTLVDPDDAPAWTEDQLDRAEFAIGSKVIRPAQGTLTRPSGRPKLANAKKPLSLRLDPDVIEAYRSTGSGWQKRMGEVLAAGVRGTRNAGGGSVKSIAASALTQENGKPPRKGSAPAARKRSPAKSAS